MRETARVTIVGLVTALVVAGTAYAIKPEVTSQSIAKGEVIYERSCMFCHGVIGEGDGPAAFFSASYKAPRPKDFTRGGYKFRSTLSGELPTDQDLFRVLTNGVPGYMPPFHGLTVQDRWSVIAYVKTLNPDFKTERSLPFPIKHPPVPSTPGSIEKGRKVYLKFECYTCHGLDGRGDGPLFISGDLKDQFGMEIAPTDLTNLPSFKDGSTPRDIVRSIMTGNDGTPMAEFAENFAGTEEDVWHLVNYILSLSPQPRP